MYLNGVGIASDPTRGRALLQSAGEHGQAAAAYVLAGEFAREPDAPPTLAREWLERSAKLGYVRAAEAIQSGRPLLDRESVGAANSTLLTAWVIDCTRKNDAAELRRLGAASAGVRDEFGRGALSYAAEAGTLAAATALLDLGADIRAVDQAGTTPLMIAAEQPNTEMTELLLQHGADARTADAEKRTALFYAARANRAANVRALQQAGALLDVQDSRGYNALDDAIAVDADAPAMESFQGLLAHGAIAAATDHAGHTALWLPASRNDLAVIKALLGAGVRPDAHATSETTALLAALNAAHSADVVRVLLDAGASTESPDAQGHTPLMLASAVGAAPLVDMLLAHHARIDAEDHERRTALWFAAAFGLHEVGGALRSAGATPQTADSRGLAVLHAAAAQKRPAVLAPLLAAHARVNARSDGGATSLL